MFGALAAFVYRRRWWTLAMSTAFLLASLVGLGRGGELTGATFGDNEAEKAERLVDEVVGYSMTTTFLVIFHSDTLDPRDESFRLAMATSLAPLRTDPAVAGVVTPDEAPTELAPTMVNGQAKSALAFVSLRGDFKAALARYPVVRQSLRSDALGITCTGKVAFMDNLNRVIEHDVMFAEAISLPLAILVLLVVFRTVVAAALPVGVGGLAVAGGIAIVLGLSHVTDIAAYTINVCSLIGLGVAIDYSLFTVSRYREALAEGHDYREALVRALEGAGRVVCFSGLVVATGLGGLLFFRGSLLFSMGIGGMIVVSLAVVFALTFLPALLAVLGPRIHVGRLRRAAAPTSAGLWHRAAEWVMRRPVTALVPTLAVLTLMASPFLRLELTAADVRLLGPGVEARRGYEVVKRDFPEEGANRVLMAVRFPTAPALNKARIDALYDWTRLVAATPHVTKVESIVSGEWMGKEDDESLLLDPPAMYRAQVNAAKKLMVGDRTVVVYALLDTAPDSPASEAVVRELRSARAVLDGTLLVGGQTASNLDATQFVTERTPRAVTFVVVASFVTLFLLFGSVVLPVKAMLLNFMSVAASFGALVWVFQEGHLGIAAPRPIEHGLPVLLFCVLFGLSMDYEVLMLSRIKEAYDAGHDNTRAVALGLEKTAGLITSAAAIMVVVFAAFALATVVLIRAVGFSMALAVAIDATLVRLLLVPASMRLFGKWNWWAPAPLVRLRAWLMGLVRGPARGPVPSARRQDP
jgi:RND superfamily putative drug exporter